MHKITGKEYMMPPGGGFICLECHGVLIKILELEEEFINSTITNQVSKEMPQQNIMETVTSSTMSEEVSVKCDIDENYFGYTEPSYRDNLITG